MNWKKIVFATLVSSFLAYPLITNASPAISLFNSQQNLAEIPMDKITSLVTANFDITQYRNIKVQVIYNAKHQPDHVLVYLFSKAFHRVNVARININARYHGISVIKEYHLSAEDFAQQPGLAVSKAHCPDNSVEFIAFAPNDNDLEQNITIDVANAAEAHGLKTIRLLKTDATRTNYLNYMKCPRLKGNFYDGDANPELITTSDGTLSYTEINTQLANQFNYKVTNIWLACEAYNDPIKTSMLMTSQSQKYAAGINDLAIGPSDKAAACAMKAAMDNKPMTAAFNDCYTQLDTKDDHWGFGGNGSEYFGV